MAESLSHKFGQIIGGLLEFAIESQLQKFAKRNKLYLDKKEIRLTRKGKKLSWTDGKDNIHDLDFVLERGGTDKKPGTPVAFIETAWRRYTKYSRNKAQEIQGAILPLAEKYKNSSPFKGVILAGIFTEGALTQLKSSGFCVLYFSYETVIKAFFKFGINANFDEKTSEDDFRIKIDNWNKLENKSGVAKQLLTLNKIEVVNFFNSLEQSISRFIERIIILPLYGKESNVSNISEAIDFVNKYSEEDNQHQPLIRYEIIIKYSNGDKIDASFKDKKDAIKFLEIYL